MSREMWKENVLAAIDETERRRSRPGRGSTARGTQFHIRLSRELLELLHAAAKSRGISITGYVRRSLTLQLARDLGAPWPEIAALGPYPPRYGKNLADRDKRVSTDSKAAGNAGWTPIPDDGTGFGEWP